MRPAGLEPIIREDAGAKGVREGVRHTGQKQGYSPSL